MVKSKKASKQKNQSVSKYPTSQNYHDLLKTEKCQIWKQDEAEYMETLRTEADKIMLGKISLKNFEGDWIAL